MKVLVEKLQERKEKLKAAVVKAKLEGGFAKPEQLIRQEAGGRKCFLHAINQCIGEARLKVSEVEGLRTKQVNVNLRNGSRNG
jgi:hypothetical protein